MNAEDPLFIALPPAHRRKGVLHTTGGYLVCAATATLSMSLIITTAYLHWCTADVGWVTGHSASLLYGPLQKPAAHDHLNV